MKKATLVRTSTSPMGTFGILHLEDGWECRTGELPWRDNKPGRSCVPVGVYTCNIYKSPKHGQVYMLEDVPGRADVEIHSANLMGDTSFGYKSELLGCIALGFSLGKIGVQDAVLQSKAAIAEFMKRMNGDALELTVLEDYT